MIRLQAANRRQPPALREDAISRDHLQRLTWIVSAAPGFFVLWGLWRYGIAADAAERWPAWLVELMGLFTSAGLITLLLLWGLIFWQRRVAAVPTRGPRRSVAGLYALSQRAFEHFVSELFERRG